MHLLPRGCARNVQACFLSTLGEQTHPSNGVTHVEQKLTNALEAPLGCFPTVGSSSHVSVSSQASRSRKSCRRLAFLLLRPVSLLARHCRTGHLARGPSIRESRFVHPNVLRTLWLSCASFPHFLSWVFNVEDVLAWQAPLRGLFPRRSNALLACTRANWRWAQLAGTRGFRVPEDAEQGVLMRGAIMCCSKKEESWPPL